MKRTLIALSIAALTTSAAFGEEASTDKTSTNFDNLIPARDIIGGEMYTTNEAEDEMSWNAATRYDALGNDWNNIGEIEDVVLDREGKLVGIVGEIGGFLDIADRHVFLNVEDVKLVPVDDREYAYVTRYSEEQLEEYESVDEGWWD